MRHSGFSMPSVSFSCRRKNRAYLSNFLPIRTASSVLDLDEQQRHAGFRGGQDDVGAGAADRGVLPGALHRERDLGGIGGEGADPVGCGDVLPVPCAVAVGLARAHQQREGPRSRHDMRPPGYWTGSILTLTSGWRIERAAATTTPQQIP
ncbi:hypothetical protein OHS71_00880 [Streptomyces sp. NBC_00377]|uniref:hypothetical protein n=1 Tax=unclassified Streptomyces TaxID=2593676 RepID=UPI002E1C4BEA|nr:MULTISPECIES: hypothetical protein [unclassified Streptomyces]